jgi:hypothetical protein
MAAGHPRPSLLWPGVLVGIGFAGTLDHASPSPPSSPSPAPPSSAEAASRARSRITLARPNPPSIHSGVAPTRSAHPPARVA